MRGRIGKLVEPLSADYAFKRSLLLSEGAVPYRPLIKSNRTTCFVRAAAPSFIRLGEIVRSAAAHVMQPVTYADTRRLSLELLLYLGKLYKSSLLEMYYLPISAVGRPLGPSPLESELCRALVANPLRPPSVDRLSESSGAGLDASGIQRH